MKKHLTLSGMVCIAMALLIGCSKSNSSLPAAAYSTSATITKSSTTTFSAIGPVYVTATLQGGKCIISSTDTAGGVAIANFTFAISYYAGVNSYPININGNSGYYEFLGPALSQTTFVSGGITITKVSGSDLYGTFSGVLSDGSVITNGSFVASGNGF